MPYYQENETGLTLSLRAQPKASRTRLERSPDGQLKARVHAPPVDNAANGACIALLAEVFQVAKAKVTLMQGDKSRSKVFHIEGPPVALRERLEAYLGPLAE